MSRLRKKPRRNPEVTYEINIKCTPNQKHVYHVSLTRGHLFPRMSAGYEIKYHKNFHFETKKALFIFLRKELTESNFSDERNPALDNSEEEC